jgi:hypothetical protein
MMRRGLLILTLVIASGAAAQPLRMFDVDDFVDLRQRDGTLFVARLIAGAAYRPSDQERPLRQNAAFLSIANSLYWSRYQFDYEHTEARGRDRGPAVVHVCDCGAGEPIYFPTPPSRDSTPAAPLPGASDSVRISVYRAAGGGRGRLPVMLRYRVFFKRQAIDTIVRFASNDALAPRLSGSEQTFGVDADTYTHIGGREVYGSLVVATTVRSDTTDNRSQTAVEYTIRFPAVALWNGKILLLPTLTAGGVSGRGGTAFKVLHPSFEGSWFSRATRATVHLVWTPQATNDGTAGWRTNQQIALFVDRSVYARSSHRGDKE